MNVPRAVTSSASMSRSPSFRPFELTYEDPDAVQVQPGGCAQVQFVDFGGDSLRSRFQVPEKSSSRNWPGPRKARVR